MAAPIRIGIIGAELGAPHAAAFAQSAGASLVGLADEDAEALKPLAEAYPDATAFDSPESLIASSQLDALVVASPTYRRERHVGAAFDAGLHALCEAPPGIHGREASHIFTSAGLVGKTFMWSNPQRFDPRLIEARRLVDAGELGEIFQASVRAHVSDFAWRSDSWRQDAERGGGALLQLGFAALDSAWFVMGCPEAIEAMGARYDLLAKDFADPSLEKPAEDTLVGMIRFKNGASLQLTAQSSGHGPASDSLCQVWGERGSLDLIAGIRFAGSESTRYAEPSSPEARYAAQAEAFIALINDGAEPLNTGKQALTLMKMMDALATSARERESAPIKAERNLEDLFGSL